MSTAPRFCPNTVTVEDPVVAPLVAAADDTVARSYENAEDIVDTRLATVATTDMLVPTPDPILQDTDESLLHTVDMQEVPPTLSNKLELVCPNCPPNTVTATPPVTPPFVGDADDTTGTWNENDRVRVPTRA